MSEIHPTAVIHPGATLGGDCVVGPYCVIGRHVTLGEGNRLHSHVVIDGHAENHKWVEPTTLQNGDSMNWRSLNRGKKAANRDILWMAERTSARD